TNFYLLRFPAESDMDGNGAAALLIANDILPRPVAPSPRVQELRITVGTGEENDAVLEVLRRYVQGERAVG
ncbi:MAG: histidinol-phosphate transaminase, partial [Gammaproteobacteria bacterium]